MKRAAHVLVGGLLLLLVWGVAIEPRLIDKEHYQVVLPQLPTASGWPSSPTCRSAWRGNTDLIRRLVARLIARRPAVVLIAGIALVPAMAGSLIPERGYRVRDHHLRRLPDRPTP